MKQTNRTTTRTWQPRLAAALIALLLLQFLQPVGVAVAASTALDGGGYRIDDRFESGTGGTTRGPTGEKPESKLWWVDGSWFTVLRTRFDASFYIYRYNQAANDWVNTNTPADDRLDSKADALWDGSKLYIVSHRFIENGGTAAPSAADRGRLYRYSYNASTKTFALDSGFPITVNNAITETLVLTKDSNNNLWVTYVQDAKVMVNHTSGGNDLAWGTPYVLPAGNQQNVDADDISSIIAYNGRVGVMWSNQATPGDYYMVFAAHTDGTPDSAWTTAVAYSASGDDHISIKSLQSDSAGNLFVVVKTAQNAALVVLLICKSAACTSPTDWTPYIVYNSITYNPTRPMLMIDESNRQLYVFTANEYSGSKSGIYYKKTSIDSPSFNAANIGTAFIKSSTETSIDDVTASKQNVNGASGLMVMASDRVAKYYVYNFLALGAPPPAPAISGFTPASGQAGASVTISGSNFTGASSVLFNGAPASFTVNSAAQITATVPAGASTGKISVTTPGGTAASAANFTVLASPPVIDGFSPSSGPVGVQVTITGSGFTGASAVTFNGAAASFTVNSATQISATVPNGASTGKISVTTPAGTTASAASFTITITPTISSFDPAVGRPGTLLNIYGGGFSGVTGVTIDNVNAPGFTLVSPGQISVVIPAGATTGRVRVTTPGGTATSAQNFTIGQPLFLPITTN